MATTHLAAAFSTQGTITQDGSRVVSMNLGAANANRKATAWVMWYRNTNRLLDVGLNIGGVACTPLAAAAAVGPREMWARPFELIAPASGEAVDVEIVAASWGAGGSSTECFVVVHVADGAEQASHVADFAVASGGPVTGAPVVASVATPSETDALVVALLVMDSSDVSYNAATITNATDRGQQINVFNSGMRVALVTAAGAATVTPQASWSSGVGGAASSDWRAMAVSIAAVGAGGYTMAADPGSFALTGNDAALREAKRLVAAAGSFALTGNDAALREAKRLIAESATFALAGADVALRASRLLTAGPATFALTGHDAGLRAGRRLVAATGAFALAGGDLAIVVGTTLVAETGAFALAGHDVGIRAARVLVAAGGAFALTGHPAALRRALRVLAESGAFALSGHDAALRRGRWLLAASGSFTLSGVPVTLRAARRLAAEPAVFLLSGHPIGIYVGALGQPGPHPLRLDFATRASVLAFDARVARLGLDAMAKTLSLET